MGKFAIWGRVTQNPAGEFVASANAIALRSVDADRTQVATETCRSRREAEAARDRLVATLSQALREQGHDVIDVEVQ